MSNLLWIIVLLGLGAGNLYFAVNPVPGNHAFWNWLNWFAAFFCFFAATVRVLPLIV